MTPAEGMESQKPATLAVRTIGMMDFTPTELFARCSGDWPQIAAPGERGGSVGPPSPLPPRTQQEAPDLTHVLPGLNPRALPVIRPRCGGTSTPHQD
eukprot:7325889-Pyramimonas_sp.AAC.1